MRILWAAEAGHADALAANGYIFATPENLAAIAGLMKDFFDRTYYAVLDRINGRPPHRTEHAEPSASFRRPISSTAARSSTTSLKASISRWSGRRFCP